MRWWWFWEAFDMQRCFLMNLWSEIRAFHDLQIDWSFKRSLTESLQKISSTKSEERVRNGGNVRVSVAVVVVNCRLRPRFLVGVIVPPSCVNDWEGTGGHLCRGFRAICGVVNWFAHISWWIGRRRLSVVDADRKKKT
jgi:hypothetical protein